MAKPENLSDYVVILDFGSQTTQLIARRCRELGVFSDIISHHTSAAEMTAIAPSAIILSGGPASVYNGDAPDMDAGIFNLGIPILGICYGMQLGIRVLGGKVDAAQQREYGRAFLKIENPEKLFAGLPNSLEVWMSHGDKVHAITDRFMVLARTDNCDYAAVKAKDRDFYGIQFHPEVSHTPDGVDILHNFLHNVSGCAGDWKIESFIDLAITKIRRQVGDGQVVLGLSGGVDSSVAAALIHQAIGRQLVCIFVDNGVLREGEFESVQKTFRDHFKINLHAVDAGGKFLTRLQGVTDPEKKRKIIGHTFIEVFKEEAQKIANIRFLAQGTIYPDVIESAPPSKGPSASIKSHHNVGGLPAELGFELVEPLRDLFKDEVRLLGKKLGLPPHLISRHPFPGPGLAIRIIGEVTEERLKSLRRADTIIVDEITKAGIYHDLWQAFGIFLPISSVGVMGDERTYENTLAVRCISSVDAMTADWTYLPEKLMRTISNRIINEVKGVNRVVYDISSKPPATIEWE
ncbi:glutamine-hydrolyzing GMP synthase [Planctomycetota bacterium]